MGFNSGFKWLKFKPIEKNFFLGIVTSWARNEFPRILGKPKVQKLYHDSLSLSPVLRQINIIHKEKSSKMQQCIKILLFHIYIKLNMFRATHHPLSGD